MIVEQTGLAFFAPKLARLFFQTTRMARAGHESHRLFRLRPTRSLWLFSVTIRPERMDRVVPEPASLSILTQKRLRNPALARKETSVETNGQMGD